MKPSVGDFIKFDWVSDHSATGIVVGVWEPPNYHSGIDYTFELLQTNGKKFIYDVFRNGATPVILARCKAQHESDPQ
jgi:hypothetical protein